MEEEMEKGMEEIAEMRMRMRMRIQKLKIKRM
jgi:hypothetical protein